MDDILQVGKPVSGEEFIGREKEAQQLFQLLKSGQSVVLIAPRRFGKTSLILRVLEMLKKDQIDTAFIDIFTTPDIKKFAEQWVEKILENQKLEKVVYYAKKSVSDLFKNFEFKSALEEFEFVLKFGQSNTDPFELLEESVNFAEKFAIKYNTPLVIGLDEFGDIEKLGNDDLSKLLRAKMQVQKKVCYVFSGSYESVMNQLFTTAKSPFYRFARIIKLDFIDAPAFQAYYISKLKNAGIEPNKKLIKKILEYTKGHPYYSALFLQNWLMEPSLVIENVESSFQNLREHILNIENAYIEKLWEDVSNSREQRTVILSLVESGKPYSVVDVKKINISRTIQALTNKGLIMKGKEGYMFTDPIFEYWLRKIVLKIEE